MNIQDRVTIKDVYIKPDGQICACVLPVPDKPQFSALERLSPATQSECNKIIELYEQALKACKESAVLFEDQFSLTILLHASLKIDPPRKNVHEEFKEHVKNDTFYPLQCEVEIVETKCEAAVCELNKKCSWKSMMDHKGDDLTECMNRKVARLIPEAKCELDHEEFTCCKCGGKFKHTQGTWLPIGVEDKQPITDTGVEYPSVLQLDLRRPEIITSKDFTCYDCTPDVPEAKEEKTIEAGRILALKEAQKFLHDELGDDWNDLCQTLYEGRILAAMYKFKCYEDPAPIVEESHTVKIEVNKNAIPRKAKLVEAYETDHQIIIMFGKEEIPESHSCDDMGCGSFSHVKYILTKP